MRDFLPIKPGLYQPKQEWLLTRDRMELALARRHMKQQDKLSADSKELPTLKVEYIF